MKATLRQYQHDLVEKLAQSVAKGNKAVVAVLPTAGGKTLVACNIMYRAIQKLKHALFVANRRKLVHQCAGKLEHEEIPHGVIMRGEFTREAPVQVCSVQTLQARYLKKVDAIDLPPADLIFFDECHVSLSSGYDELRERYPNAVIIGLTATPVLGNGKGLGALYKDMVFGPSVSELTAMGFLCPVEYYGADAPDLSGVKINKESGEFDETSLSGAMDKPKLIGDIVQNWRRICPTRPTFVFGSSVDHSIHLCEQFNLAGFKAEHIDAHTEDDAREDIFARFIRCETQILCNYGVLVEGVDIPSVECIVLATSTRNPGRYIQIGGRGLRPSPMTGKTTALIIDHGGNIERHGWLDDDREWSLDANETIQEREFKKKTQELQPPKPRRCPSCGFEFKGGVECPKCGHKATKAGKHVPVIDAELRRLLKRSEPKPPKPKKQTVKDMAKQDVYSQLLHIAQAKNRKEGWAAHLFKESFGEWPNGLTKTPQTPSKEVNNMVRARNIRRAYGLRKGQAA